MLQTSTLATFAPWVGETFRVHPGDAPPFDVDLVAVTALGGGETAAGDTGRRTPFPLVFRRPADRLLPQRIYRLEHGAIGGFELFLVPIGRDGAGVRFEAVFT